MFDITTIKRNRLWAKFKDQVYRRAFVASHLSTTIAAQIFSLREARGWTQKQLADRAGMAQARISVMEDPSYESFSLSTLKRIAAAFDVALVVRFVPYSELLDWATNVTPSRLTPSEFKDDRISISETRTPTAPIIRIEKPAAYQTKTDTAMIEPSRTRTESAAAAVLVVNQHDLH